MKLKQQTTQSPVVAIMPSGKIARFPEKSLAKAMLLKKYHDNIFESADDIYLRMPHDVCLAMIEKLSASNKELLASVNSRCSDGLGQYAPEIILTQPREAANHLWNLMYQYADKVFKYNGRGKIVLIHPKALNPDEGDFKLRTYWLLYEPGVDPVMDAAFISLPPQARQCLQVLLSEVGKEVVSEATVFKHIMRDKQNLIQTKQSKWRIFKYYRSMLIVRNFLRMRG